MSGSKSGGFVGIMSEILAVTQEMALNKDNAEEVVGFVEKRGALMNEFDALRKTTPNNLFERERQELHRLAREIMKLSDEITDYLRTMRSSTKRELRDSTQQNKILNYANQTVASSGSYMDIKE